MGVDSGKGVQLILTIFVFLIPVVAAIWVSANGRDIEKRDFTKTNWRIVSSVILVVGLIATFFVGRGYALYDYNIALGESNEAHQVYLANNEDLFNVELEYGDDFELPYDDTRWALDTEKTVDSVDNMVVGKQVVIADFVDKSVEEYDINQQFEYIVNVVDTQLPTIAKTEDMVLQVGDGFDKGLIPEIIANDPIDGALEVSINGLDTVKTDEPEVYEITVSAKDNNGNQVEDGFKIIVLGYTNEELARMAYLGDFGNGVFRQLQLGDDGYSFDEVQRLVNKIYYGKDY